jgi:hypothetical protein
VKHEPAILMNGTPAQHREVGGALVGRLDLHLLEHVAERHGQRTVEHDAQGAFLTVLADQRDGLGEIRIGKLRHRDQQVVRKTGDAAAHMRRTLP